MIKAVAVLLGGALGSLIRYGLAVAFPWKANSYFPVGTLSANLIGCFCIGLLWGIAEHQQWQTEIRLLIFTGLLGGFTTFSSFALESTQMLRDNNWKAMLAYVAISNVVGILLTLAGWVISKR